jgi:hypothetical protein
MANEDLFGSIVTDMVAVLTKPADFFKNMPKEGGYVAPLVFMVAMALATAVVMAVIGMLGFGTFGMMAMGFMGIIIFPIMAAICGFIGAAILFVIWKIMGSEENFETAYRCMAYSYAYAPVAAVLNIIPYLGAIVGAIWPMALLALASINVHGRSTNASWAVFGVIGLVLAMMAMGGEKVGRHMQENAGNWQQQFQQGGEEMSPEEAGKAMGEFLKGLEESQGK